VEPGREKKQKLEVPQAVQEFAARLLESADNGGKDELFLESVDVSSVVHAERHWGDVDPYLFSFDDGETTWNLWVSSKLLRRIASGAQRTVSVQVTRWADLRSRKRLGEAFAVWGTEPTQRCVLRSPAEVAQGLARERARGQGNGCILGSPCGDLVFVTFCSDGVFVAMSLVDLRLHNQHDEVEVVTEGDHTQAEPCVASFPWLDKPLPLLFSDYVPFDSALNVVTQVISTGGLSGDLARAILDHPRRRTGVWIHGSPARWKLELRSLRVRERLAEQRIDTMNAAHFPPLG
jgi:hypothetical protein